MSPQTVNATKGVKKDDIIVAFMGPTGSGKSYFIDLLTGESGRRSGNSLASVTSGIEATRVQLPNDTSKHIVLVDTPGFDDSTRSDMEILHMISDWLKATYVSSFPFKNQELADVQHRLNSYESGVKLSGLIYLHRITDNRMAGSPYKNLRMFGELCGDLAMNQVILVTTMWGRVEKYIGEGREQELKDIFWRGLINKGSRVDRLDAATGEAAWRVVGELVQKRLEAHAEAVLLQEELVDNGIKLNETHAGKALYSDLQKKLAEQKDSMKSLLAQVEKSNDPHLTRELRKEYERLQREFDRTFTEAETLKISFIKKLLSVFANKKTKSKAVKVDMPSE
ncbi:hypothetical protein AN958_12159 [Leucoagaricus sp. SymC.cos]|nr:hypothetical protein AN958_12159 [Leucoagaricus sp. SymC.cos]